METMFGKLKNNKLFKPKLNHTFSGRDNDNDSFVLYPLITIFNIFLMEIKKKIIDIF